MRTVPRSLRVLSILVLPLLVGGLTAACVSEPDGASGVSDPNVYHVTKERNGATIQLRQGQQLSVVLPKKVGSASSWTVAEGDPSVIVRDGASKTIGPRTRGGMIGGAPGYEQLLFSTVGPGMTPLHLTLERRQRDGGGTMHFQIVVVVH